MSPLHHELDHDLERTILEMAAWNDRRTAHDLLLVSRHVKTWIQPIVYWVVTLLDAEVLPKRPRASCLQRFMVAFKAYPKNFFATNVKHLCLSSTTTFEQEQVLDIFAACTSVESIAYGGHVYSWERVIAILHSTNLTRLHIELPRKAPTLHDSHVLEPYMGSITHLDVLTIWPHASVLDMLPNLTHMALDFDEREEGQMPLMTKLSESPRIIVVAFIVRTQNDVDSDIVEGFGHFHESRFVPMLFDADLIASDWHASAAGEKDMWWRAEEAASRRRETFHHV